MPITVGVAGGGTQEISTIDDLLLVQATQSAALIAAIEALESITATVANWPAVQPVSDNGGALTVDGTVSAAQSGTWNIGTVSPGTGAANLGKAEDALHASGDTGVALLAVRKDVEGTTTSADGRYGVLQVNAAGALRVEQGRSLNGIGTTARGAISCTTSGVLIRAANTNRHTLNLVNYGGVVVFLHSTAGDHSADGTPLFPGQSVLIDDTLEAVYGTAASGTVDVRYCEVSIA